MTRLPAEWEPHEGTAMCWPVREDMWGDLYGPIVSLDGEHRIGQP